ncbi:MAG: DNA polymerase III subunit chi [Betaproteobacteria bacterium]
MTSIDFYFNADDRIGVACRLAGKALQQKKRVLIYAPQAEMAQKIDRLLWVSTATSFIPHCYAHDPAAADTPVLIASGDAQPAAACDVLLNLSPECAPFFERHGRVLEIVDRQEDQVRAGRARFRFYRDRGYEIRNHDLAKSA